MVFFVVALGCIGCVIGGVFLLVNLIPGGWDHALSNSTLQSLLGVGFSAAASVRAHCWSWCWIGWRAR